MEGQVRYDAELRLIFFVFFHLRFLAVKQLVLYHHRLFVFLQLLEHLLLQPLFL